MMVIWCRSCSSLTRVWEQALDRDGFFIVYSMPTVILNLFACPHHESLCKLGVSKDFIQPFGKCLPTHKDGTIPLLIHLCPTLALLPLSFSRLSLFKIV